MSEDKIHSSRDIELADKETNKNFCWKLFQVEFLVVMVKGKSPCKIHSSIDIGTQNMCTSKNFLIEKFPEAQNLAVKDMCRCRIHSSRDIG